MKVKLQCYTHKVFADQLTPVGLFLTVRNLYHGSILLESSEFADKSNSRSIICANPIGSIKLTSENIVCNYKDKNIIKPVSSIEKIQEELKDFFSSFEIENNYEGINGFFGHQTFEAVKFFESEQANLCPNIKPNSEILHYRFFQYVICFNHFNSEVYFIENTDENEVSCLQDFVSKVLTQKSGTYPFKTISDETANCSDDTFIKNIKKAQFHCQQGDVFQLVLSRRYKQHFKGDEFNVYRALRHINPSPYMFYFDYGSYKIFGSSPEAQLRITDREATINPIAGTYKRTGNKEDDEALTKQLLQDTKELSEHAMLVDLARNDLNRSCSNVNVSEYQTIQLYSHVIHIVSTVKGVLKNEKNNVDVLADTFPAGTLTGAPKIRAIQLLNEMEGAMRGFYGGSIGFIDFNGDINQAIIIRSFMSKKNTLHFQAGAGIVLKSLPENELQEVHNKLGALRQSIQLAQNL
jgi:anthranilate synthase component 1